MKKANTKEEHVRCTDCGMVESKDWAFAGKHICIKITDPNYRVMEPMTLQIGKKRFVKLQTTT